LKITHPDERCGADMNGLAIHTNHNASIAGNGNLASTQGCTLNGR